ncbi:splicing factor, proline- and glutamine-rich-like [Macaca nemestrina]|uniref:splicing factor, proline- and glutamine-rich-like n=1 Tax=Macaca nemestrina TaxID=9545 RepID=UPI0039B8D165
MSCRTMKKHWESLKQQSIVLWKRNTRFLVPGLASGVKLQTFGRQKFLKSPPDSEAQPASPLSSIGCPASPLTSTRCPGAPGSPEGAPPTIKPSRSGGAPGRMRGPLSPHPPGTRAYRRATRAPYPAPLPPHLPGAKGAEGAAPAWASPREGPHSAAAVRRAPQARGGQSGRRGRGSTENDRRLLAGKACCFFRDSNFRWKNTWKQRWTFRSFR